MDSAFHVADEKYSATYVNDGGGPRVVLRGTISTPNPAERLNPLVDAVHEAVSRLGVREVKIDMQELEFCNSSGFKAFIHWVQRIQAMPEGQRYALAFLLAPARRWQRTSLLALSCYGPNVVVLR